MTNFIIKKPPCDPNRTSWFGRSIGSATSGDVTQITEIFGMRIFVWVFGHVFRSVASALLSALLVTQPALTHRPGIHIRYDKK